MTTASKTIPQPLAPAESGRFFRLLDWSAFWSAFALSFAVYCMTLAPTVSLEDSGELATAGAFLGVPHPPGYPIWSLMAWVFTKIFFFVPYLGQPNPAWSIGLMSAFFGALATGLTALLLCRSGYDLLDATRHEANAVDPLTEKAICWAGGVVGSLLFAFSNVNWSQSVIVEVYSLNAFFLVLVLLLIYVWIRRPSDRLLVVISLVFGLGLTNYQALLLMLPALMIVVLVRDLRLFRDFVVAAIPYLLVIYLIKADQLPAIVHPLDKTGLIYGGLDVVAMVLIYFFLPRGKVVALAILAFQLGLAFYAYMPLSSETNPPMNWGYPRTYEGFKHAISRGQYEKIVPTDVFSSQFVHQMGEYLTDLRAQFTLPLALLGFLPFTIWKFRIRGRELKIMNVAIALAFTASCIVLVEEVLIPSGIPVLSVTYKLMIAAVMGILVLGATALFVAEGDELMDKLRGRSPAALSERITVFFVLLGVAAVFLLYVFMLAKNLVEVTAPLRQAGQPLAEGQLRHIVGSCATIVAMMIVPAFLYIGVAWSTRGDSGLRVVIDRDSQKWFVATLCSFVVMSALFIALANPKGDIQDYFIQRVKFISSHALYAFWIGYGIIFGLTFGIMFFRNNPLIKWAGIGAVLLMPAVPILENAYNPELLRIVGGAEQQWHDFGWQFGNYQLRGAEAILEELAPDEEPLPNPEFPPEMGPDAIFFGGTDPGRFVPTYMIYSAKVREDVYLITQNALADNTYMSVMRDLYGDRIWIPAQMESATAFQRYVEEVRAGKRPQNAELKIEGGRVQVSGALGVMEINGILAQMIFEHNRYRHPFYVEESYVIRWMYPFLTPHGLIMKINPAVLELGDDVVRADTDFWDWYTRRLIGNERFIRDIVARKSFSKLRSAIGGLYSARGRFGEAEQAFQQARLLYSLSPEANFRLAQEVHLSHGRFGDAREVIRQFSKEDPGNTQARSFISQIDNLENVAKRIGVLEGDMSQNKLTLDAAFELAGLYQQVGQGQKFLGMMGGIVQNTNLPPAYCFRAAQMFMGAGRTAEATTALDQCMTRLPSNSPPEVFLDLARMYASAQNPARMSEALQEYLKRRPSDWRAWLDEASIKLGMGRNSDALKALEVALRTGGNEAVTAMNQNPAFAPVRDEALRRARSFIGFPDARTTTRPW